MARRVFYSFDYERDLFRVQQIRNIGVFEESKPVSINKWEEVEKGGDTAIKHWIDENMFGRTCVIVLVGERTYKRKWVKYEITKAWKERKGILGIHIHNLNCLRDGYCSKGANPFDNFTIHGEPMSSIVKCYNPKSDSAYVAIKEKIEDWVEKAIEIRNNFKHI